MSHFSVIVIGENVEAQLAPYHEFECTGLDDQYVQDMDVTDECKEHGLGWHGLEDKTVTDESQVDRSGPHKYGYAIVDAAGNLIKAVNRTNPNKTWDWWVVGGRWSGFLKLKAGEKGALGRKGLMGSCANDGPGRADCALKRAVDLAGMRDDAGADAGNRWDKANAASGGVAWRPWHQVRDIDHAGNIEKAREAYNAQPVMIAVKKALGDPWVGVDDYLKTRDAFVQAACDSATAPYAIVKDGEWISRGRMGWFGMSDDKVTEDDWNRKVNELLDSLPGDTRLTVVDCHI